MYRIRHTRNAKSYPGAKGGFLSKTNFEWEIAPKGQYSDLIGGVVADKSNFLCSQAVVRTIACPHVKS